MVWGREGRRNHMEDVLSDKPRADESPILAGCVIGQEVGIYVASTICPGAGTLVGCIIGGIGGAAIGLGIELSKKD